MNFRTTLILIVLLAGVGAYLFFTSGKSSNELQKTNPRKLLDMASNDVNKVVLTPAGDTGLTLERSTLTAAPAGIGPAQSDWKITAPITAFADAMKVSDLLDALTTATSTSQVSIGASAADYGLDTPQIVVDLDAGPKSVKLDIGRQEQAGNELYVRVEGKDTVQVVSADLLDKLQTTADKLRLARLVNADATTANWVSLKRPIDPLELEKVAGQWQIKLPTHPPTTMPAEQSIAGDLISAINNAQAVSFGGPGDNAALLIGQPQATVTISDQKPTTEATTEATTQPSTEPATQTETIEFGSPDSLVGKNVWVRVTPPGLLAKVPNETMDGILKSPLDLRSRDVLKVDPATVKEVRIVKTIPPTTQPIAIPQRTSAVALERRPPVKIDLKSGPPVPSIHPATQAATQPATQPASVWLVGGIRVPVSADDAKVDALLATFNPLRVDKYLAAPTASPTQTTYLVTLTTDKGAEFQVVLHDPGEGSTDSATGTCGDATFALPRTVITTLDADFVKKP